MPMLGFVLMIALVVLTIVKLAATVVPSLDFMNKTPVAIAHALIAVLAMLFAILAFSGVASVLGKDIATLDGTQGAWRLEGSNGIGTLLLLVAGIGAVVTGITGALTRLRINTLKDSTSGKSGSQPSGGAM